MYKWLPLVSVLITATMTARISRFIVVLIMIPDIESIIFLLVDFNVVFQMFYSFKSRNGARHFLNIDCEGIRTLCFHGFNWKVSPHSRSTLNAVSLFFGKAGENGL